MTYIDFVGLERTVPLYVIEWLIVFVGVVGNILVIILIALYDGVKKAINKILFINLAVADLGFLLIRHSFDFLERYYVRTSTLGVFLCEVLEPISMAFFPASLLIIITISYYRYHGIVKLGRSELSVTKASFIVGIIWTATLSFYPVRRIPFTKWRRKTNTVCEHVVPKLMDISVRLTECAIFVIFVVITFIFFLRMRHALMKSSKFNSNLSISLRINQNLKTLRVLKSVIIVLFLTVSPQRVLYILRLVTLETKRPMMNFQDYLLLHHLFSILIVINSSANPFIYAFASRDFRTSLKKLLNRLRLTRSHRVTPPRSHFSKSSVM